MGWIYAIVDSVSGKTYVGQTAKPPQYRWSDHRRYARQGKRHPLYAAMAARPDAFEFHIVAEVPDELMSAVERDLIALGPMLHPHGFNLQEGGIASYRKSEEVRARMRGKKVSPETRAKLSASHMGLKRSAESLAKFSAKMKGRKLSPEAIEKTRKAQTGRKVSEGQKERLRQSNLGKKHSSEHKAKISASIRSSEAFARSRLALIGKTATDATRAKISAAHSTPEARARAAAHRIGKPLSEATRKRMSESHQRRKESLRTQRPQIAECVRCANSYPFTLEFFCSDRRNIHGLSRRCKKCHRIACSVSEASLN